MEHIVASGLDQKAILILLHVVVFDSSGLGMCLNVCAGVCIYKIACLVRERGL